MIDQIRNQTNSPRDPLHQGLSFLAASMLLGFALFASACGSSGPQMSGFALGDTRIVSSGDVVTLRSPLTLSGERQWRVVSYDSVHLSLLEAPRFVAKPDGTGEIVTKARAKAPGLTEIVFAEIRPSDGREARTVTFKVRIKD